MTNFHHQDVHYVDYMEYISLKSLEDWFAVRSSHDNEAHKKILVHKLKLVYSNLLIVKVKSEKQDANERHFYL